MQPRRQSYVSTGARRLCRRPAPCPAQDQCARRQDRAWRARQGRTDAEALGSEGEGEVSPFPLPWWVTLLTLAP